MARLICHEPRFISAEMPMLPPIELSRFRAACCSAAPSIAARFTAARSAPVASRFAAYGLPPHFHARLTGAGRCVARFRFADSRLVGSILPITQTLSHQVARGKYT